ncbi:MAG: glycoside hydrolase family 9 protein, partial [Fibromonadales bacterium]|nr:glycoside hydrolase family 9 protein [Fibromonadales bacterium]
MRKTLPILLLLFISLQSVFAAGAFTADQYKKALWMVTRFYGAQRSGNGPNWLLMDHTHNVSFIKDADGSRNLVGGWFDCGDHVLFGQTFFYSAYMLALAYEMFPKGFRDLYHGNDYSDYAESKNWSMAGGKPNTTPDLLEELKYATDWIIKATPDENTFYYQKGDGDKDHKYWVTAGFMSTLPNNDGGESDKPRDISKNPEDGVMASFAASTLAIMSKIYRKYDAEYADSCLKHAKNAYGYASKKKNNSIGAGGYYQAHKDPQTVFVTAASEMYLATNENTYLNAIDNSQIKGSWHVLDYANTHDLAAYAAARAVSAQRTAHLKLMLDEFVTKYVREVNSEKVTNLGGGWGQLRYAGNTAFSVALYSLAMNTSQYDQFIYDQIDYVLGNNSAKQSFIVGFCEGCTKQPKLPHHRNVFLRDDNPDDSEKERMTIPERNKYFGQLMGGTRVSSQYTESVTDYTNTEGGIDYNAGLVGALAYVVAKLAPADTSKFGTPPKKPNPEPDPEPEPEPNSIMSKPNGLLAQNSTIRFAGTHVFPAQGKSFSVQIFNSKGNVISVIKSNGEAVKFTPQNMG